MNSDKSTKPKFILFVDDEPSQLKYISLLFHGKDDYIIELACDSKEAIEKIRNFAGKIDLLILDMMLPDMYGDELYEILQQEGLAKDVPAIFQTGMIEPSTRIKELVRARKAEFIHKPYLAGELFTTIEKMLKVTL